MNNIVKKTLLFVLCLFFALACHKNKGEFKMSKQIIKINNKVYTAQDIWDYAGNTFLELEIKDLSNSELQKDIMADFIEHKLLLEEAAYRNIKAEKTHLDQIALQLSTDIGAKELKALTGRYDTDPAVVTKMVEERLIIDQLFREISLTTGYVTENELKEYYQSKDIQVPVGEAHIMQIFTTDNESINKAAQELAEGILFTEVARKYSQSPEAALGGDMGLVKKELLPEFFQAAFILKEGEISDIIKSDYGYHIFKTIKYSTANDYSYENMKNTLVAEFYSIKRQETIKEFINALYSKATIEYINTFTIAELIPERTGGNY